jgi:hypothetical protein
MKLGEGARRAPPDAAARQGIAPVICYPVGTLPKPDLPAYRAARADWDEGGGGRRAAA